MSVTSFLRGHPIFFAGGKWYYADTREQTAGNERPCGHCGKESTTEGHDGCLGTLHGVMNACCGHGVNDEAYLQLSPEDCLRGKEAVDEISRLRDS